MNVTEIEPPLNKARFWRDIWYNPIHLTDSIKDTDWVKKWGIWLYLLTGLTESFQYAMTVDFDLSGKLTVMFIVGTFYILILRFISINAIYFIGKLWDGQATKRQIDTVIALGLTPEIFKFLNLIISLFSNIDNVENASINPGLFFVCAILSIRLLIIGIARIQKFTYGFAILNVILPQIAWMTLVLIFKG
jgi:hypothetical protein